MKFNTVISTHNFGSPAANLNAFQHFLNRNHLRFTGWPGGLIFISQRRNPEEEEELLSTTAAARTD